MTHDGIIFICLLFATVLFLVVIAAIIGTPDLCFYGIDHGSNEPFTACLMD